MQIAQVGRTLAQSGYALLKPHDMQQQLTLAPSELERLMSPIGLDLGEAALDENPANAPRQLHVEHGDVDVRGIELG